MSDKQNILTFFFIQQFSKPHHIRSMKRFVKLAFILSHVIILLATLHQEYPTISKLDCSPSHIIHRVTYLLCDIQYVGQTSKILRARFCSHRNTLKNQDKPNTLIKHQDNYLDDRFSDLFNSSPIEKKSQSSLK